MRKLTCVLIALAALQFSGCAAMVEGLVEGMMGVHHHEDGFPLHSDYHADPEVLKRKGLEPDSRRAKAYEAEMRNQHDVDRRSW